MDARSENIYERPCGKSYRRTKEDNSNNNSPLLNIAPYSISSCNDQDSTVNIDIMEFIISSEYHLRSWR